MPNSRVFSLPIVIRFDVHTLSNEVYYDHTDVNYEVLGIVPHIQAPVFSPNDIKAGHNALEAALEVLTP